MLQHAAHQPNLSLLPLEERWPVARALAKVPGERFDCCKSFVHALRTGQEPPAGRPARRNPRSAVIRWLAAKPEPAGPPLERQIAEMLARAGLPVPQMRTDGTTQEPGAVARRFISPQLRGLLRLRLGTFEKFWGAATVRQTADEFRYRIQLPASFRSRYPVGAPELDVEINLNLPHLTSGPLTEVEVRVRADGGAIQRQMLDEVGPLLLESLRSTLDLQEDRRESDRVGWTEPLVVWPVWPQEDRIGDPLLCRGRDVSLGGLRLLAPAEPGSSLLWVQLGAGAHHAAIDSLARVVRVAAHGEGFEVGVQFCQEPPPVGLLLAPAALQADAVSAGR